MKQRTRFSGLLAILCLLAFTAAGQSYTIHFIKGTERINHQRLQTADNLEELITLLSDCRHQLSTDEYTVSLTALQSVSKRYDPAARELAMRQATFLQEYLTGSCCLDDPDLFELDVDTRTDLDNRVIVEVRKHPVVTEQQKVVAEQAQTKKMKTVTEPASKPAPTKTTAPANHFLWGAVGLGIKTNALLFAGLLPDGSMYSPVANAAAEVYFMDRFSAQVSFAFAMPYNKGDRYNLFSMTCLEVEPRWWLWGDSRFRGLYAGVYGQYGSFNVRIKEKLEDNSTGLFYGAGISVGWLQPVWRGFYVEAGLQVGYRNDAVDVYELIPGSGTRKLATYTLNSFTLQGMNLSVGYRF
ncbi:DUF3575 domain-containing protein [Parabacteroides gordonii]|uniref:Outer membrane protein beta-barrel domain-containing protein n=1 Tax=Parabacteroides gordonii MS-1 = DSM 23371 TaxID=1203610 RepID=A0A0F5JP76_9BACT|nr:DUF3575 domain-containing protein [Parabacteroides gordonii]KKB59405.1 hypothetical protein HMPREF1536_00954 [Parabacteroides gordonii MS-1 = DSM 23371]MCA5583639.1 DUF3575 domain-containing protein [Parabacteroides gordonii]RGP15024.1 DUF3575 domain-containing protein [Parabacteroides gordonii]